MIQSLSVRDGEGLSSGMEVAVGRKEGFRPSGGEGPDASFHPNGCSVLPRSRHLWLVRGNRGAPPLRFTSFTYFWALIYKGLSCRPTLPSGPISACLVNQACLSDASLLPPHPPGATCPALSSTQPGK